MNIKEPLISVIIPTFNRIDLLKKALNSALNQTYKNLEIIITDDKSSDGTSEFCQNLKDPRVKYVVNETHEKGPNGNKNNGFDICSGEFICLIDDDDELYLTAISECFDFIKQGYSAVFADCVCEINEKISGKISGRNPYEKSCEMSKIDYHCGRISGEYFKLFSRKFIENFRLDEKSFGGENELYIRFFEDLVYYHKKPLYIYRIARSDSATANAAKYASKVANAYLKTANLCHEIASVMAPEFLALQYKNAAYYAKIAGKYALMYECLFKSLRIKFNKEAFIFLLLSPLPGPFLQSLSKLRVKIKERFGI